MNPPKLPIETPDYQEAIEVTNFASAIEALLRSPQSLIPALKEKPRLLLPLLFLVLLSAAVFGLVLGTFSGQTQLWAAPLKVMMGLMITATICFPSLYIFSCLSNSPLRLAGLGAVYICYLALFGLLLIAFAPVLWIFAQSSNSITFVGLLALVVWGLSYLLSNSILRRFNRAGDTTPWQIHLWLLIFLTVTLQMSTALRPLLGTAKPFFPTDKKFFLAHWSETFEQDINTARQQKGTKPE